MGQRILAEADGRQLPLSEIDAVLRRHATGTMSCRVRGQMLSTPVTYDCAGDWLHLHGLELPHVPSGQLVLLEVEEDQPEAPEWRAVLVWGVVAAREAGCLHLRISCKAGARDEARSK